MMTIAYRFDELVGWEKAFAQYFRTEEAIVRRAHQLVSTFLRSVMVGTALCLRTWKCMRIWPAPLPILRLCALTLACSASLAHAQGDAARGEKKFEDCASCHSLTAGENGVGPSLADVIGRKAGTLDDYRYSPALKRSNIVWSPQTLETFIADPQKAVPANRMPYAGLTNAGERRDLIAYLQKMSK
jgi:cytochrome c2